MVAAVTLTLLPAVGTAACSTPTAGDAPSYAVATQDDPQFESTFRHEFTGSLSSPRTFSNSRTEPGQPWVRTKGNADGAAREVDLHAA